MSGNFGTRRSTRWRRHGYVGTAAYFITLCVKNRDFLFGEIRHGEMILCGMGQVVANEWLKSGEIRKEIKLDEFVVMQDHFHAIVWIEMLPGAHHTQSFRRPKSLGSLIAAFKAMSTRGINAIRQLPGVPAWQRNYHDHVIRNDAELNRIREYIRQNPRKWQDRHPAVAPPQYEKSFDV